MNKMFIAIAFVAATTIAGCATTADDIVTEPLTKSELEKVLIGNSYPLGSNIWENAKGGAYFSSATNILVLWDGNKEQGTWRATDTSEFCISSPTFGTNDCTTLLRNITEGGFVHRYNGENRDIAEDQIVKGDIISDM
tara:strand:+ start:264 stop:677 length:414 start_codon:yes stop_codon:yes gene_type:complete